MGRFDKITQRSMLVLLCGALLLAGCKSRVERAPSDEPEEPFFSEAEELPQEEPVPVDNSYEAITEAIDLPLWDRLTITYPEKDAEVDLAQYYITGVSDPERELLLNGEPVEARGELGGFGVYVELEEGENFFAFRQGEDVAEVTITRDSGPKEAMRIDNLRKMRPEIDVAARGGTSYLLSCTAPAGSEVTARIGERSAILKMDAVGVEDGVAASYTGEIHLEDVDGTRLLGPVTYILEYGGETSEYSSAGSLYVAGSRDELVVRCKDAAASVFVEASDDRGYYSTLLRNGVDVVTEIGGSMYRLGMGGWVFKTAVEPLTEPTEYQSRITGVRHEAEGRWEILALSGMAPSSYRAERGEEGELILTLYHATGLKKVELQNSVLLESVEVAEEAGNTLLTFRLREELWSYQVVYGDGEVWITLTGKPELGDGDRPLEGITIALDAGHGGNDGGAEGVARQSGPDEAAINLAAAKAVRTYLQGLGATVMMIREDDSRVELDDRLEMIRNSPVDLSISLHCNSIDPWRDGTGPSGVETYYFEEGSRNLAEALQTAILAGTGRKNREVKRNYFKVTLNSGAPSVLVEMGFLTNPAEYDALRSPRGIYSMAEAIGEGVLACLS